MIKRKYVSPYILLGLLLSSLIAACGGASTGGSTDGGTPIVSPVSSTATPASKPTPSGGGASISKPFVLTVTGAQCYAGQGANKGDAAFGFPTRESDGTATLAFTLGPLTDGSSPGQEHNAPYIGAGSYTNIGIFVRPPSGTPVAGFGTVVVNADLQTGTFLMDAYAGTWNCGSPVNP